MPWDTYARTLFAADKAMKTGKVTTLNSRDWDLYGRPISLNFSGGSSSSGTYATVDTIESVRMPVYSENVASTVKLKGIILGQVASSSTGNARLQISTLALDGADSAGITSVGANVDVNVEVTIPAGTTPQVVDINIQVKNDSGVNTTVNNSAPRASFWFEVA